MISSPNPVLLEIARFRAEEALSGPPQVTKTMLARQRLGPERGARECALGLAPASALSLSPDTGAT